MERTESDSTGSLDENTENFCGNPTSDVIAQGILNIFKPTVEALDEKIVRTRAAQAELKSQLDSLHEELLIIEQAQKSIPEFSGKVKELINIKHKVTVITNILTTSQERLNNLHKIIEREERRRQALLDSALNTNIS